MTGILPSNLLSSFKDLGILNLGHNQGMLSTELMQCMSMDLSEASLISGYCVAYEHSKFVAPKHLIADAQEAGRSATASLSCTCLCMCALHEDHKDHMLRRHTQRQKFTI